MSTSFNVANVGGITLAVFGAAPLAAVVLGAGAGRVDSAEPPALDAVE